MIEKNNPYQHLCNSPFPTAAPTLNPEPQEIGWTWYSTAVQQHSSAPVLWGPHHTSNSMQVWQIICHGEVCQSVPHSWGQRLLCVPARRARVCSRVGVVGLMQAASPPFAARSRHVTDLHFNSGSPRAHWGHWARAGPKHPRVRGNVPTSPRKSGAGTSTVWLLSLIFLPSTVPTVLLLLSEW